MTISNLSDRKTFLISPVTGLDSKYFAKSISRLVMAFSRKKLIDMSSLYNSAFILTRSIFILYHFLAFTISFHVDHLSLGYLIWG